MITVKRRSPIRQLQELAVVDLSEELILPWGVSDLDFELGVANFTKQDLWPERLAS